MRFRMAWIFGLALFSAFGSSAVRARELLVVSEAFAPYVFDDEQGQPTGFDYDVSKAVLARLGYSMKLSFAPWKRALLMAQQGEVDALLGIGRGDQNHREDFLAFPDEALSGTRVTLFYLNNKAFRYDGLFSLAGKTVGTRAGYAYSPDFANAPYFRREPVETHEQNLHKLLRGRVDFAMIDTAVGIYTARQLGVADQIAYEPVSISGGKLYIAFSRSRGLDALARDFSKTLLAFKQTAEYQAIFARYGIDPASVAPPEF
ncbi:MAG: transporter substrate-binding domain-containing protein [Gammaproteobacteria bacterium]|nr:transporter substrate-binding domain-containing protein [Gammaproteobacteria bacterium]